MKTFAAAFRSAVGQAGFKRTKSLADRRRQTVVPLYQAQTGERYRLEEAVIAAARRQRG